jgi:hypothetical protein
LGHAKPSYLKRPHFFSAFSAQKTHVKPQNDLNHANKTRSSWRISFANLVIIEIGIKKSPGKKAGALPLLKENAANPFAWTNLAVTPLFG